MPRFLTALVASATAGAAFSLSTLAAAQQVPVHLTAQQVVQAMSAAVLAQPVDPAQPGAAPATAGPDDAPPAPTGGPTLSVTGDGLAPAGAALPAIDKAGESPTPKKEAHWIEKFGGSAFFTQTSVNLNAFAPSLQLTRNTSVDQWLLFAPRYAFNKDWQIRGRFTASYEYTNSDTSTYRNEFLLGDAGLQLFYRGIPAFFKHTKLNPFVSGGIPLSKESRARTMYGSLGLGLQLVQPFEHVLGGDVTLIVSGGYSRPFYEYTTPGLAQAPRYAPRCYGLDTTSCVGQVSGTANARDQVSTAVVLTGEWGKFSPGLMLMVRWSVPYDFKAAASAQPLEDRTALRQSTYLLAFLDYHLTDWLTPELGYFMDRNVLDGDGKLGNPIFSQSQDMRVYLGFNIQLDSLYKAASGMKGEGGVVRATNEKKPIFRF